jgi:hypothetical protein
VRADEGTWLNGDTPLFVLRNPESRCSDSVSGSRREILHMASAARADAVGVIYTAIAGHFQIPRPEENRSDLIANERNMPANRAGIEPKCALFRTACAARLLEVPYWWPNVHF